MNLSLLAQIIISGLAAGAAYALSGIGFSLVYRMSGALNFAHGQLVTFPLFVFLFVLGGGGAVAVAGSTAGALALAALVAAVSGVLVGMALQRGAVQPFLRRQAPIGWIAATGAAGILLTSLVGLRFQAQSYTAPDILPASGFANRGVIDLPGGGIVEVRLLMVLAIALILAVALDRWLSLSRAGKAMRATAEAPDAARLVGISPERMQLLAWGIAGFLSAVVAIMIAPSRPVTLELGAIIGLKGVAAAVLGRLGSARGAVAGGLAIGVGESLLTNASIPQFGPFPGLQDVAALVLLVLLIAFAPGRLGGREAVE